MKLYVWENPWHVDYGTSLVIAVADSLDEAKRVATEKLREPKWDAFEWDKETHQSVKLGGPHEIIDCPTAAWFEWRE